jgi:hypothetical protein
MDFAVNGGQISDAARLGFGTQRIGCESQTDDDTDGAKEIENVFGEP